MNKELSALLEKLAAKLGTTTEYLWGVLLKQARIAATMHLLYIILIVVAGVVLYKMHIKLSKPESDKQYAENGYEKNDAAPVIMVCVFVIWLLFTIIIFCTLSEVTNGYFNPEYWALKEILDSL